MVITCIRCDSQYDVTEVSVPKTEYVRCGACGHLWVFGDSKFSDFKENAKKLADQSIEKDQKALLTNSSGDIVGKSIFSTRRDDNKSEENDNNRTATNKSASEDTQNEILAILKDLRRVSTEESPNDVKWNPNADTINEQNSNNFKKDNSDTKIVESEEINQIVDASPTVSESDTQIDEDSGSDSDFKKMFEWLRDKSDEKEEDNNSDADNSDTKIVESEEINQIVDASPTVSESDTQIDEDSDSGSDFKKMFEWLRDKSDEKEEDNNSDADNSDTKIVENEEINQIVDASPTVSESDTQIDEDSDSDSDFKKMFEWLRDKSDEKEEDNNSDADNSDTKIVENEEINQIVDASPTVSESDTQIDEDSDSDSDFKKMFEWLRDKSDEKEEDNNSDADNSDTKIVESEEINQIADASPTVSESDTQIDEDSGSGSDFKKMFEWLRDKSDEKEEDNNSDADNSDTKIVESEEINQIADASPTVSESDTQIDEDSGSGSDFKKMFEWLRDKSDEKEEDNNSDADNINSGSFDPRFFSEQGKHVLQAPLPSYGDFEEKVGDAKEKPSVNDDKGDENFSVDDENNEVKQDTQEDIGKVVPFRHFFITDDSSTSLEVFDKIYSTLNNIFSFGFIKNLFLKMSSYCFYFTDLKIVRVISTISPIILFYIFCHYSLVFYSPYLPNFEILNRLFYVSDVSGLYIDQMSTVTILKENSFDLKIIGFVFNSSNKTKPLPRLCVTLHSLHGSRSYIVDQGNANLSPDSFFKIEHIIKDLSFDLESVSVNLIGANGGYFCR